MLNSEFNIHEEAIIEGTLHELLDERAIHSGEELAFRFLPDGEITEQLLTYGELNRRSRIIAAGLINQGATGKPVILVHPPGLGFIEGLFACWHAGATAVPAYPPRGGRHRRRLDAIVADSAAKLALAPMTQPDIPGVRVLKIEELLDAGNPLSGTAVLSDFPSLLQYTSGSTSNPKGVKISHQNIRRHFAAMRHDPRVRFRSAVSWLPPFHDMGLILKILFAFEAGIPLTFFPPEHFVQRPIRWLRAISRYRAEFSGAPNFAFEMCVRSVRDDEMEGLDLSCWTAAPCSAERINPDTLERFARRFSSIGFQPEAFLPAYGLAEATLTVAAATEFRKPRVFHHPQAGRTVSSGKPLDGLSLRLVQLDGSEIFKDRVIGEIRVKGDYISTGYWNRTDESLRTFGQGSARELVTGDLGFFVEGELFVTGRIKDLIIIDGTNHSPEDIEMVVCSSVPDVHVAAAFQTETESSRSIIVAVETNRNTNNQYHLICNKIRSSIGSLLEIPIDRIILVRSGLLPRTTSGKIRRSACREALSNDTLKLLYDDGVKTFPPVSPNGPLAIVMKLVAEITCHDGATPQDDIVSLGMTSMETTRLAALLRRQSGVNLSLGELFGARSFHEVASLLSEKCAGKDGSLPEVIQGSDGGVHILTHSQERMWYLHQLDPQSAAYHVFGALQLLGPFDLKILNESIATVVARHDILQSRHGSTDGRPTLWIEPEGGPVVEYRTVANENDARELLSDFARQPFDLAKASPLRTYIVTCGANSHILAVCAHHIVVDGWSIRIIANEIRETYTALVAGEELVRKSSPGSYLDYAVSHRKWIDSGAVNLQIDYWKERLAGHPGILPLVTDFPRPPKISAEGGSVEQTIPADLCNLVASIAKLHRGTPFMVHLAVFLLFLRHHGSGDDPVVAVPVANRNHAAASDLIGTLVNTLPFRLQLDPLATFETLIEQVREATFEMHAAQEAPFEKIIEAVKPDRAQDHSPLAQVMFDYQEILIPDTWGGNLQSQPFSAHRGAVQFDLSLMLNVMSDRQQLSIEYRSDLFHRQTAEGMILRYLQILESACRQPSQKISAIEGLTADDRQMLADFSQGPIRPEFPSVVTLKSISKQSLLHPAKIAVISSDQSLDFQSLETRSDVLAARLHAAGVHPGDRLAILLDRNIDLPIALLAIWKTGAAYVPLDRSNPPERLQLILEDQDPVRVLVSPGLEECLPQNTSILILDDSLPEPHPGFKIAHITPSSTAYVIYTSGSTGKPKGVVISHGALANFLQSMVEASAFSGEDRLLAVTTISFDISALELFLPLMSGGCVDIVSTAVARDGESLLKRLTTSRPTIMQATPATWRLLLDSGWQGSPHLKMLCGGEALDLALAKRLRTMGSELWNLYGPTETTVWSSLWKVPKDPDHVRIGRPIGNTGIHILASDGTRCPPGVTGEIWISGAGLADGYWNRPDLTNQAFVACFERRYHTGDLGRWHSDGNLECLGRSDGQIKIRGFRVETGEIESALTRHPKVGHAKVALRQKGAESSQLVAWVTPVDPLVRPEYSELRDFLSGLLPFYMLPSNIGVIDEFPLGSSGKVDISKLEITESLEIPDHPLTETEKQLAEIWQELLIRPTIRRTDDWFHIGGHSLLALRLFSRIRSDFGRSLPLSSILDHSVLGDLAEYIEQTLPDPPNPSV